LSATSSLLEETPRKPVPARPQVRLGDAKPLTVIEDKGKAWTTALLSSFKVAHSLGLVFDDLGAVPVEKSKITT
jgi:hypothetical protein